MNKKIKYGIIGGALLGLGVFSTSIYRSEKYNTLVMAQVLEEKIIKDASAKESNEHYVLHLNIKDDKNRPCTLYVSPEKEMPISVLQEGITPGSNIALKYWEERAFWRSPVPVYDVGCFGTIASNKLEVITAFESSDAVKAKLQGKLDQEKQREIQRANLEIGLYHAASKW